jgi:hypothetical protein
MRWHVDGGDDELIDFVTPLLCCWRGSMWQWMVVVPAVRWCCGAAMLATGIVRPPARWDRPALEREVASPSVSRSW